PRVNIGAIRGGVPYKITKTVQQCAIYLDVRITPVQNPLDIREDLHRLVAGAGLGGEVELYTYRPAFEADPKKVEPLASAITRAHQDRKSTRLNSSHVAISYAVFCLKKKRIFFSQLFHSLAPSSLAARSLSDLLF